MDYDDRFDKLEERVDNLAHRFDLHEERHGDDADRLNMILGFMKEHTTNHHGLGSKVKQSAGIGGALAMLGVLAELIRQFFL